MLLPTFPNNNSKTNKIFEIYVKIIAPQIALEKVMENYENYGNYGKILVFEGVP